MSNNPLTVNEAKRTLDFLPGDITTPPGGQDYLAGDFAEDAVLSFSEWGIEVRGRSAIAAAIRTFRDKHRAELRPVNDDGQVYELLEELVVNEDGSVASRIRFHSVGALDGPLEHPEGAIGEPGREFDATVEADVTLVRAESGQQAAEVKSIVLKDAASALRAHFASTQQAQPTQQVAEG